MPTMFPQRLEELRREKKLTQEDVGEMLGFVDSTISQYETGKREPDYETLAKIANIFDVTTDYLLGNSNQRKEKYGDQEIIAAHKAGDLLADLPPKARESVEEYIDFVRKKHRIDN